MWFFSNEQRILQQTIRQFSTDQLAPFIERLDRDEGFNRNAFEELGKLGLLGVMVSEENGGTGLGAIEVTLIMEEMGAVDASTTLSYLAHTVLCVHQIELNGNQSQKQKYLPPLLQGQWIGGMGMSEPDAGSDVFGMKTKATLEGRAYSLNGSKTWITNGPVGDVFYCYARTGNNKKDISTFIIEKNFEGFSSGKKFFKMGMRASPTGELIFSNCKVPVENRIGQEGESIQMMMQNLDLERIAISGISLGIARSAIEVATRYAKERKAFGKPIGSFQQIQERLAEASSWYEACRSLTYQAAKIWDLEPKAENYKRKSLMAAQAKLQSAQMATQVSLDAIQILGGCGYTQEFPVERYMRDAKLIEIGAGTNEILRLIIARHLLGNQVANA